MCQGRIEKLTRNGIIAAKETWARQVNGTREAGGRSASGNPATREFKQISESFCPICASFSFMKSIFTHILFCIALLVPMCAAFPSKQINERSSVVLTVKDQSGATIPNAEVLISPLPTNLEKSLVTDRDGRLSVGLPPGLYTLTVNAQGFVSATEHFELKDGANMALDVVLTLGFCAQCVVVISDEVQPVERLFGQEDMARLLGPENFVYPDDADGLRQFLLTVLGAAKSGDIALLKNLIKQTEIPNFQNWFISTFGEDKGESWAGPYGQRLEKSESLFQERIIRIASQSGEVSVQKLDPTKMFDTVTKPIDLFLADWNPSGRTKNDGADHIGYFFFIDGKFRWDSTTTFVKLQDISTSKAVRTDGVATSENSAPGLLAVTPGVGGVGFPSCLYCPPPEFPKGQRHLKDSVAVLLKGIIQTDGHAVNIEIVRSGGVAFDEKALETVRRWRFRPAIGPNGTPIAVVMPIEVSFHSLN